MSKIKSRTRELKNFQVLNSTMVEEASLEGNIQHEDTYKLAECRAFAAKMIPRMRDQGIDMKLGDSEDCLSYRELKIIGKEMYEQAPRTRSDYETHLSKCNVCGPLLTVYQEYLKEKQLLDIPMQEQDKSQAYVLLSQIAEYVQKLRQPASE